MTDASNADAQPVDDEPLPPAYSPPAPAGRPELAVGGSFAVALILARLLKRLGR